MFSYRISPLVSTKKKRNTIRRISIMNNCVLHQAPQFGASICEYSIFIYNHPAYIWFIVQWVRELLFFYNWSLFSLVGWTCQWRRRHNTDNDRCMQIEMPFVFSARIKLNEHNQKHTHTHDYYIYFNSLYFASITFFAFIVLHLSHRRATFTFCRHQLVLSMCVLFSTFLVHCITAAVITLCRRMYVVCCHTLCRVWDLSHSNSK